MKNHAFTLAEVLITLGIIGVVAAMTIPSMINKTNKQELQSQLKKSYSTLLNATNQLKADNGFNSFLTEYPKGIDSRTKFMSDLKPYLRADFCKSNDECGIDGLASNYLTLNKNKYYLLGVSRISLHFQDGSIIRLSDSAQDKFYIDINGYKRKPNRAGYDVFAFDLTSDGKIIPATSMCSITSTGDRNGDGCTAYALSNKSPTGSGDYWNDFLPD